MVKSTKDHSKESFQMIISGSDLVITSESKEYVIKIISVKIVV